MKGEGADGEEPCDAELKGDARKELAAEAAEVAAELAEAGLDAGNGEGPPEDPAAGESAAPDDAHARAVGCSAQPPLSAPFLALALAARLTSKGLALIGSTLSGVPGMMQMAVSGGGMSAITMRESLPMEL